MCSPCCRSLGKWEHKKFLSRCGQNNRSLTESEIISVQSRANSSTGQFWQWFSCESTQLQEVNHTCCVFWVICSIFYAAPRCNLSQCIIAYYTHNLGCLPLFFWASFFPFECYLILLWSSLNYIHCETKPKQRANKPKVSISVWFWGGKWANRCKNTYILRLQPAHCDELCTFSSSNTKLQLPLLLWEVTPFWHRAVIREGIGSWENDQDGNEEAFSLAFTVWITEWITTCASNLNTAQIAPRYECVRMCGRILIRGVSPRHSQFTG